MSATMATVSRAMRITRPASGPQKRWGSLGSACLPWRFSPQVDCLAAVGRVTCCAEENERRALGVEAPPCVAAGVGQRRAEGGGQRRPILRVAKGQRVGRMASKRSCRNVRCPANAMLREARTSSSNGRPFQGSSGCRPCCIWCPRRSIAASNSASRRCKPEWSMGVSAIINKVYIGVDKLAGGSAGKALDKPGLCVPAAALGWSEATQTLAAPLWAFRPPHRQSRSLRRCRSQAPSLSRRRAPRCAGACCRASMLKSWQPKRREAFFRRKTPP